MRKLILLPFLAGFLTADAYSLNEAQIKEHTDKCNAGNGDSCYELSSKVYAYCKETNCQKEYFEVITKGCNANHRHNCGSIGHHYWQLWSNSNDKAEQKKLKKESIKYYEKACKLGSKTACINAKDKKLWKR